MKAYVGVTDGDWYRFLAERRFDEVNFWRPGGDRAFRVLSVGEPFFFKAHAPDNRVVGGGFFSGFAALTIDDAWRFYGEANGAESLEEMRKRVSRYRRQPIRPGDNPTIGCVFLRDVECLPPDDSVPAPPDFAGPIVQGKGYDIAASTASTSSYSSTSCTGTPCRAST